MSSTSEEQLDLVLELALHAINRADSGDCLPDGPQFADLKGELLQKVSAETLPMGTKLIRALA